MPQLDIVTFLSQYFWTSFFFIFLFFTLQKYILPKVGRILFYREKKLIEFQFLEEKGSHVNSFQPRDHQFLSHPSEFSSNLGNHLTKEGFPVFENDRKLFFLNHSYTPKYFNKVTLFLKNSSIFPFHRRIDKTGEKSIFHTYNFYTAFSFLLENWKQYNYILFLTKLNLLSISDFNKKMVDEKMENWEEEQSFFLLEEELFSQFRFFFVVSELISFDEKS